MDKGMISKIKEINKPNAYIKDLHFTRCKCCGSKNLVKFDADTFCMDCDWNSVVMDVDCGNFEKRIAIVNRKQREQIIEENETTNDEHSAELIGA